MEQPTLQEFDAIATDTSITTEQLDSEISLMKIAQEQYDKAKAASNNLHAIYQEHRAKVITMLKAANKKKYHVDGLGTASVTEKLKVTTPKGLEAKEALFNHLTETLGHEGFLSSASVNYATLNRIYNEEFDKAKEEGTAAEFSMPGVDQPQVEYGLSFRK